MLTPLLTRPGAATLDASLRRRSRNETEVQKARGMPRIGDYKTIRGCRVTLTSSCCVQIRATATQLRSPQVLSTKKEPAQFPEQARIHGPVAPVGNQRASNQVFIELKKSPFVLVDLSLSMRNSMASMVPIGLRMRRSRWPLRS